MLAKLTSKNQLTLPKSVTETIAPVQYFEVQSRAGQIILTPVRIQRGDALRAKLAELKIDAKTIESALSWAGTPKASAVAKKAVAKPLSEPVRAASAPKSRSRREDVASASTAGLKASLSLALAKAAKR